MSISERIFPGQCQPSGDLLPQIEFRTFASGECGAKGMTTASVTFSPGGRLPYHAHTFSEAVTVLDGEALFAVEGRSYRLRRLDCIHIPSGVAHEVTNSSGSARLIAHCALASSTPTREMINNTFRPQICSHTDPTNPESILRFSRSEIYQLADGAEFRDLFAGRYGSVGICGGYARFNPGSSLPCHIHDYDESISIVEGKATCEVAGRRYSLSGLDTAFVPQGKPHRFLNESDDPMAMIWVYAGSEPSRTIINTTYCTESMILHVNAGVIS
jgi:quercetin dioxygenase-like cupin family protein